jgi:hypothetical protein
MPYDWGLGVDIISRSQRTNALLIHGFDRSFVVDIRGEGSQSWYMIIIYQSVCWYSLGWSYPTNPCYDWLEKMVASKLTSMCCSATLGRSFSKGFPRVPLWLFYIQTFTPLPSRGPLPSGPVSLSPWGRCDRLSHPEGSESGKMGTCHEYVSFMDPSKQIVSRSENVSLYVDSFKIKLCTSLCR